MDDAKFCPVCGKGLPAWSAFCPGCGSDVSKAVKRTAGPMHESDAVRDRRCANVAATILFICAAIGFITGIIGIIAPDAVADMFFGSVRGDMEIQMAEQGETWDDFLSGIELLGELLIFGGVLALIAAALALKQTGWIASLIMSLLSMLILLLTFFGAVLCFVAIWKFYKARPAFR